MVSVGAQALLLGNLTEDKNETFEIPAWHAGLRERSDRLAAVC